MRTAVTWLGRALLCLAVASACDGGSDDSSTHWLQGCTSTAECGSGFECLCGLCTKSCETESACSALGSRATCVSPALLGPACQGTAPSTPVCLEMCVSSADCSSGLVCNGSICSPLHAKDGSAPDGTGGAGSERDSGSGGVGAHDGSDDGHATGGAGASGGTAGSGGVAGTGAMDAGADASTDSGADSGKLLTDAGLPFCPVGTIQRGGDGGACVSATDESLDVGFVGCRVKSDGTLWCWDQGGPAWPTWQDAIRSEPLGTDSDWKSISLGGYGCGIRGSGALYCFGDRIDFSLTSMTQTIEELPARFGTASWSHVSVGQNAACGIQSDGTLWCWGMLPNLQNDAGFASTPTRIGTDSDWAAVDTQQGLACAIRSSGALYCFGENTGGALGDGTTTTRLDPTPVKGGGSYTAVAIGAQQTCGLRTDKTLWCWGTNFTPTPTQYGSKADWIGLTGHRVGVVGLEETGKASWWTYGATPGIVGTSTPFTAVGGTCGEHADHSVSCWGTPSHGSGKSPTIMSPVRVGSDSDWVSQQIVWQWHVGLHTGGRISVPGISIDGTTSWTALAPSPHTAYALRSDGALFGWGASLNPTAPGTAIQIGTATDWIAIANTLDSYPWACGIRATAPATSGTLWCSVYGSVPNTQIGSSTDWVSLSGNASTMCGVHGDGSIWCGALTPSYSPQFSQVGTDLDWAKVATAQGFDCAIKTNGSLWCWGNNANGQLGNGTVTTSSVPVQVAPGTTWAQVTTGWGDTMQGWVCGIQTNGTLWCWGADNYGQLGLGTPGANRLVPMQVGTYTDWQFVTASASNDTQTCAIRQGQLWCMGQNAIGGVTLLPTDLIDAAPVVDALASTSFCPWVVDADYDGYAACLGDCDDGNALVNPFMSEVCNGIDDNCDGVVDEGCP